MSANRRALKKQETRAGLLAAARRTGTVVSDIASAAGAAHGTVYVLCLRS